MTEHLKYNADEADCFSRKARRILSSKAGKWTRIKRAFNRRLRKIRHLEIAQEVMLRPIKDQEDHRRALARIDELMDAAEGTPEADELEVLAILVAHYERQVAGVESAGTREENAMPEKLIPTSESA